MLLWLPDRNRRESSICGLRWRGNREEADHPSTGGIGNCLLHELAIDVQIKSRAASYNLKRIALTQSLDRVTIALRDL